MALKIGFAAEHSDDRTIETTNGLDGIPGTWFTLMVRKPAAVDYSSTKRHRKSTLFLRFSEITSCNFHEK